MSWYTEILCMRTKRKSSRNLTWFGPRSDSWTMAATAVYLFWPAINLITPAKIGNKSHGALYGPLTRYVEIAHATGMPGTFLQPPTSKVTASWRSQHASRHVRHLRAMMHVGIANPRWRGNVPSIPGACTTRNFTLIRVPWNGDNPITTDL